NAEVERIQQDPRLTANRSKSVNNSIADDSGVWGYVGHEANLFLGILSKLSRTWYAGSLLKEVDQSSGLNQVGISSPPCSVDLAHWRAHCPLVQSSSFNFLIRAKA